MSSGVDANQAIKRAFDSATDKLRVDADIDAELSISHESDSIKVGDGTDLLAINADGSINVSNTLAGAGLEGALSVSTSAVEVAVGLAALAGRKLVTLYNNSSNVIYWGYTEDVLSSTGTPIAPSAMASWAASDTCPIYAIAGTGSNDTRVTESG